MTTKEKTQRVTSELSPFVREQTWVVQERFVVARASEEAIVLQHDGSDTVIPVAGDLIMQIVIRIESTDGTFSHSKVTVEGIDVLT